MATGRKKYAGNPQVRFDEGEAASASTSSSVIADDTHFAGMGVITSATIKGIEVNFR